MYLFFFNVTFLLSMHGMPRIHHSKAPDRAVYLGRQTTHIATGLP